MYPPSGNAMVHADGAQDWKLRVLRHSIKKQVEFISKINYHFSLCIFIFQYLSLWLSFFSNKLKSEKWKVKSEKWFRVPIPSWKWLSFFTFAFHFSLFTFHFSFFSIFHFIFHFSVANWKVKNEKWKVKDSTRTSFMVLYAHLPGALLYLRRRLLVVLPLGGTFLFYLSRGSTPVTIFIQWHSKDICLSSCNQAT